jgi:hypothetical protein
VPFGPETAGAPDAITLVMTIRQFLYATVGVIFLVWFCAVPPMRLTRGQCMEMAALAFVVAYIEPIARRRMNRR